MEERNEVEIETAKKDPLNVVGVIESTHDEVKDENDNIDKEVKINEQAIVNDDSGDQGKTGKCV